LRGIGAMPAEVTDQSGPMPNALTRLGRPRAMGPCAARVDDVVHTWPHYSGFVGHWGPLVLSSLCQTRWVRVWRKAFSGLRTRANKKMTTLDRRLYAWLSESDDRRFERAFNAYFSVAFPAVVRHLARLSQWDAADLEDLAQDALLRFFDRVGRARRQASETIGMALTRIRPLDLGPLHKRQVTTWTGELASFRTAAMGFRLPEAEAEDDSAWKVSIRALTDRIPGLRRQGFHLLNAVRLELRWVLDVSEEASGLPAPMAPSATVNGEDSTGMEPDDERQVAARAFAEQLANEVSAGTPRAREAATEHRELLPFVEDTSSATEAVPRLRVPTNGYLFEMALTLYLDQCKSRGRKKRGGTGAKSSDAGSAQHPLDAQPIEAGIEYGGEYDGAEPESGGLTAQASESALAPSVDPTRQLEEAEFLEKFHQYLRRPVDEAMSAYQDAAVRGKATAERRRLESLSEKFARTMSVLTLLGEGHTQENTAERLRLTRNQVKYIVELVQESFERFTAADRARSDRPSGPGVTHHV